MLTDIPNIGPATAQALVRAGIHDAGQLRALGADAAYAALLRTGTAAHFISYYALVLGLQGRPWHDCRGPEKAALRVRFDALKAGVADKDKGRLRLEAALDEIGLVSRR